MSTFNFVMTFLNTSGKKFTITLKNVKPALTVETAKNILI